MKKLLLGSIASLSAAALCLGATGTASADEPHKVATAKTIDGAFASVEFYFQSRTLAAPMYLKVQDTKADGYHARVRVVAKTGQGTKTYAWRSASGEGAVTKATTELRDSSGIHSIRLQVCTYNGGTQIQCGYSGEVLNYFG